MGFPDREHRLLRKRLIKQEPPIKKQLGVCGKPSAASAAETLELFSPLKQLKPGTSGISPPWALLPGL